MSLVQQISFIKSSSQISMRAEIERTLLTEEIKPETSLDHITPLPMRQMFMIGIVTFIEMLQFSILFPFVYFMVEGFHVTEYFRELIT
jgi:hypothetical protein